MNRAERLMAEARAAKNAADEARAFAATVQASSQEACRFRPTQQTGFIEVDAYGLLFVQHPGAPSVRILYDTAIPAFRDWLNEMLEEVGNE